MAYVKTEWQDGVSGNTPINATNLNNIENGIENNDTRLNSLEPTVSNLNNKRIITIGLSEAQSFSTTEEKINLNKVINFIGTGLALSNKEITIGSGINNILISGQGICNTFTTDGLRRIIVKKNNVQIARAMSYYTQNFENTISITPILISVEEGDVISFSMLNQGNTTLYGANTDTYFTIEVIN